MTAHDTTPGGEEKATESIFSRRALLALLFGGATGATAAATVTQSTTAAGTGGLGEAGDPLAGAFLEELDGPVSDTGDPIDQLVNVRLAETGTTVNADPNTLVIRYQP